MCEERRLLIKKIAAAAKASGLAWEVDHEGGNHTIYALDGLMIPIPRHIEIGDRRAADIFKECEPKLGRREWA